MFYHQANGQGFLQVIGKDAVRPRIVKLVLEPPRVAVYVVHSKIRLLIRKTLLNDG